jgi:mRNA-degrading endonuclease toxin of MazEF toxin-antitoxin module
MTTYSRGDIVLFALHFTDRSGRRKNRPVIILSTDEFHQKRGAVIIEGITTRADYSLPGEWMLHDWKEAGLRAPSRASAILETVDLPFLGPKLGSLSEADLRGVETSLRSVLGL